MLYTYKYIKKDTNGVVFTVKAKSIIEADSAFKFAFGVKVEKQSNIVVIRNDWPGYPKECKNE